MDCAASEFYVGGNYDLDFKTENNDKSQILTPQQLQEFYTDLSKSYNLISIEDAFDQDDWESYTTMTANIGEKIQIVGDDLLVTNPERIQTAIDKKACNALLLKVNQIGTVTESIKACQMAQNAGWGVMVSHRSGETGDTFIADLVVGLRTGEIKTGAPCRGERLAKYNQLLRIAEELGDKGVYAGTSFRAPLKDL